MTETLGTPLLLVYINMGGVGLKDQSVKEIVNHSSQLIEGLLSESWRLHKKYVKKNLWINPDLLFGSLQLVALSEINKTGKK